jgi:hypothetical protein
MLERSSLELAQKRSPLLEPTVQNKQDSPEDSAHCGRVGLSMLERVIGSFAGAIANLPILVLRADVKVFSDIKLKLF